MKHTIYSLISIIILTFSASDCYSRSSVDVDINIFGKKIKYVKHIVSANEDIYSILNRYGIRITDLVDDNESVDLLNLQAGNLVQINKKEVDTANSTEIDADFKQYTDKISNDNNETDSSGEKKYLFHTVKKGDTMYSLGRYYRVSVSTIEEENPQTIENGILKEGSVIKIPNKLWKLSNNEEDLNLNTEQVLASKIFKRFGANTPINISLLMPFKDTDGSEIAQFTEFYQGFMLGLDSMKTKGISVDLNVYNIDRTVESAMEIIDNSDINLSDLIIGPVYSDQFIEMASWAASKNIPIISPLASINYDNNGVFHIAPNDDTKYDKINQFLQNKNIVYIKSIDDDEGFVNSIKEISGKPDILEIEFNPKEQPIDIVEMLSSDEMNLFVVATKKGDLADAILSKLSSVKTFGYNKQIEVLCSSQIARTQEVNSANMFRLNVSFLTTYHVNRTDRNVISFDNKYISVYGGVPSLYAYRGYDIAIIFSKAMKEYGSDFVKFMDDYRQKSLSVEYNFQNTTKGGYTNDEWTFVTYTPNYKILVR
ncbi:MAG: LysM peptidoglycan-binding domain-containing protein [Rikenellaceae bacterium]